MFMTLLAAFETLLHKYTAQEDIIVGAAVANRNWAEIEPLIGFFVNMLPIRIDLSGNPRFSELLRRVKEATLGGLAHQDLPFEKLVEEIQFERSLNQMPLFNVAFGVQNAPGEDPRLHGIKIRPMVAEQEWARLDLTLWITEGPNGMQVVWTYRRILFEEETIIRMHRHFETLLVNIVGRPEARLTTLDLTPQPQSALNQEAPRDEKDSEMKQLRSIKRSGITLSTTFNK